jgi:cation diffusion facilitator family transporter
MPQAPPSTRRVLTVSFLVDLTDVATSLVVVLLTGSAVVFAELAQGVADVAGSLLLVVGERRARRPHDADHPLGYGREAFFWSLLSALALLLLGALPSAWRGLAGLAHPDGIRWPGLALAMLAVAVVTNGYSVALAIRRILPGHTSLRDALAHPSRPLLKTALLRDVLGTASSLLGLLALTAYVALDLRMLDAVGALLVAVATTFGAVTLVARSRALITGWSMPRREVERLRAAVLGTQGVVAVNRITATYAGPQEVAVGLDLDLDEDLDTSEIERLLDDLQRRLRASVPELHSLQVDLNSPTLPARTHLRTE